MVRFQLLKTRSSDRVRPTVGPLVGDAVRIPDVRLVIAGGDVRNRPLTQGARVEREVNNDRNPNDRRGVRHRAAATSRSGQAITSAWSVVAGRPGLLQVGADGRPRHLPEAVVEACHPDPALELGDAVDQHRVADRRVDRRGEGHLVDAGLDGGGLGGRRAAAAVWKAAETPVGSSMNAERDPVRRSRRRPSGRRGSRSAWPRLRRSAGGPPRSSSGSGPSSNVVVDATGRVVTAVRAAASIRSTRLLEVGQPDLRGHAEAEPTQREHDRRGGPGRRAPSERPATFSRPRNPPTSPNRARLPWPGRRTWRGRPTCSGARAASSRSAVRSSVAVVDLEVDGAGVGRR